MAKILKCTDLVVTRKITGKVKNYCWFNTLFQTVHCAENGMCEEFKIAFFWNTVATLDGVP